jgi:hypothetical protein
MDVLRWVERHEGVLQFSVDLTKIVETLEKISEWRDPSTAGKAASLVRTLFNAQFILSVLCPSDILSLTQSLSKLQQKTTLDLNDSAVQVNNTISILASRRENVDNSFNNVWQRAENLADQLGVELNIPRIPRRSGRQIYRANHEANSAEEYYRVSIYAPLQDFVLTQICEKDSQLKPWTYFNCQFSFQRILLRIIPVKMTKFQSPSSTASDLFLTSIRALLLFC